jgi:diadenosine tetraphosphate (Ap4A) HIT family hydrolase
MHDNFLLHPALVEDTIELADWPLCRILLMNNRLFPWLILVPRRAGMSEVTDLSPELRERLWDEVMDVSERLKSYSRADKMNIASLGNVVTQLHVHVIARFRDDTAWPKPVWGQGYEPYSEAELGSILPILRSLLTFPADEE